MLILMLSAAASWFMTGLIWFVQIVHYPQFADVSEEGFCAYHARHTHLTTLVVAGPMAVETITAMYLMFIRPTGMSPWMAWLSLGLVGVTWLSTAGMQVPAHQRLASAFSTNVFRRLCVTNWIRTIGWTIRAAFMMWVIAIVAGK